MCFDEPPDPEPNPCPLCEDEIGYGTACAHCSAISARHKAEDDLSTIKHNVRMAARHLATAPIYVDGDRTLGISERFAASALLVLNYAGLPVSDEDRAQAFATAVTEYGWMFGSRHDPSDEDIVKQFRAALAGAVADVDELELPGNVLDRRTHDQKASLWYLTAHDGSHFVATDAEKMRHERQWSGGQGGSLGSTLRECIDSWLSSMEGSTRFWMEVYSEYQRPPAEIVDGCSVTYVVGDSAYTAHVGTYKTSPYGGTGFGGAPFTVRLADGREFFSNNNWSRGTVPPKLRDLLKPNAAFVNPAPLQVVELPGDST